MPLSAGVRRVKTCIINVIGLLKSMYFKLVTLTYISYSNDSKFYLVALTDISCFIDFVISRAVLMCSGLPRSGKKFWKILVREKSGNYIFSQGNLKKKMRKVREFQNFPKKMLVASGNFSFHNLQAILEKESF